MTWALECDDTLHAINVKLLGYITGPELREVTTAAIALLKKQSILRVLVDTTALRVAPSIVDIYNLPAEQYLLEHLSRKVHIALILPKTHTVEEAARFYETACLNRGWTVRSFFGRDEATAWLQGADVSNMPDADDAL